ncbi:MAG: hypothetical protein U1E53_15880 [Dongiaceae bacterium]
MPQVDLQQLRNWGAEKNLELYSAGQGKDREIQGSEGSWGGRLMRNLKIPFQDRSSIQEQYRQAKHDVLQALKAAYGEEIGLKAFRPASAGRARTAAGRPRSTTR